jgi:hypothetical protein
MTARIAGVACALRRGDQMRRPFAAVHESAIGTKRTSKRRPAMSAFGGKADINQRRSNVCF